MLGKAPLEEQMEGSPLLECVPWEDHAVWGPQGYLDAIEVGLNLGDAFGGEASLENG